MFWSDFSVMCVSMCVMRVLRLMLCVVGVLCLLSVKWVCKWGYFIKSFMFLMVCGFEVLKKFVCMFNRFEG